MYNVLIKKNQFMLNNYSEIDKIMKKWEKVIEK